MGKKQNSQEQDSMERGNQAHPPHEGRGFRRAVTHAEANAHYAAAKEPPKQKFRKNDQHPPAGECDKQLHRMKQEGKLSFSSFPEKSQGCSTGVSPFFTNRKETKLIFRLA
jgi:hypothetical protein